jgi:ATP-dependent DNA helicase DinG
VHSADDSPLEPEAKERLAALVGQAQELVSGLHGRGPELLEELAQHSTDPQGNPLRITDAVEESARWQERIAPAVDDLGQAYRDTSAALGGIRDLFEEMTLSDAALTPLLDVSRARRRLASQGSLASDFLDRQEGTCRWLAPPTRRGAQRASLHAAPIDVAPVLQRILWGAIPGTVATSATLTVGGRFGWWARRSGLTEASESAAYPSPFHHAEQALLALPRDLPNPNEPDFLTRANERILQAIWLSGGGTFVLCTSYAAIDSITRYLRQQLPGPVLAQGEGSRHKLLVRFREDPRCVLVATDSFWEGVDVKGHALRQVIIPRLPFRVPSDPLAEAQYELERERNRDPFKSRALPRAVIKLRQGYGRLIRSHADRGVVLILDRRIHERTYGRVMLASLPPAQRINAPWRRVREALEAFWAAAPTAPKP